jgi:hypothetical protein
MTEQSTLPETHSDLRRTRRLARPLVEALLVLLTFALVGAACGWLWEHRWTAPQGIAYQGRWYPYGSGVEHVFDATGSFVVIAAIAGLVLGLLCAWFFTASEIGTVIAVLAGGALAAWLMHTVGLHLAPSDLAERAKSATDATPLKGSLRTYGDSYRVAFPGAAVAGPMLMFLCFPARHRRVVGADPATS